MTELEPERIVRLEDDAVVVLDQRRLPDEVVELRWAMRPRSRTRSACSPSAARRRSASPPRTGWRSLRARGRPRHRVRGARVEQADRGEPPLGARRDARRPDAGTGPPSARRRGRAVSTHGRARGRALSPAARVLTHCNAGGLATGGYGTALGAIRAAWEPGLVEHVWVGETRPLLQGARLTAWELEQLGIPHAVIADAAAASLMAAGEVDLVVTGADRIAANGDTANKIGTYGLAVLARHHGLPLVVVAPTSTPRPRRRDGRRDPDRGARSGGGDVALPGPKPRVRRHAGRVDLRDRHGARHPPPAVLGDAAARRRSRR